MNMETLEECFEAICKRHGNNFKWPPYPTDIFLLSYKEEIKRKWTQAALDSKKTIFILPMEKGGLAFPKKIELSVGDRFNAIVMPPHVRKGYKGTKRIFQFRLKPNDLIGYICYDMPSTTLKKEDIKVGFVYRFEVISINHEKGTYDCAALAHTFNKDNLEDNLTYCYYEKHK